MKKALKVLLMAILGMIFAVLFILIVIVTPILACKFFGVSEMIGVGILLFCGALIVSWIEVSKEDKQ